MLFYADNRRTIVAREVGTDLLTCLSEAIDAYLRCPVGDAAAASHGSLVGACIALGEIHQAIADGFAPTQDEVHPEVEAIASAGIWMGRCVHRSARSLGLVPNSPRSPVSSPAGRARKMAGGAGPAREIIRLLGRTREEVSGVASSWTSEPIATAVPEGYAFYGLYPECYFASLERVIRDQGPCDRYTVIGIRSIGTSLAYLVAGGLAEQGAGVRVETVRPRGYPFQRHVEVGPRLRARLREEAASGTQFIVVDEGPGLSCSSFLSVCSLLNQVGVPDDELIILSAWQGMPGENASPDARDRWCRLRVYHTSASETFGGWRSIAPLFERAVNSLRGHQAALRLAGAEDLSYGRWRERVYSSPPLWPAVHRNSERIKLLLRFEARDPGAAGPGSSITGLDQDSSGPTYLAKFAGLGEYGRMRHERAMILASAGFSPPVHGHAYGFLLYPFLAGRPLSVADMSPDLLNRMVDYYAFIAERFRRSPLDRFSQLDELIRVNSLKGLGLDCSEFIARWEPCRETINGLQLTLLDGRPQPHEWMVVAGEQDSTALKTDSADHFSDHTLVGEQSILWDLAGAWEEWEMTTTQGLSLLSTWERRTGDRQARRLIDFYRAAYLAFRLGATFYAIESAAEAEVRSGLEAQRSSYAVRLRTLLTDYLPATISACAEGA